MFSAVQQREYDNLELELEPVPLWIMKIIEQANFKYQMEEHIYNNHPDWIDSWEWLKEFSTTL